ncbi:MAG TPA: elongation factor P [bacterium]|jgi:elongation factor P|nr:elongation factor P [bacterium]HNS34302.1 elongation factor P [bacterium]HNW09528.1 elongation factor P [bacterium]HNZ73497.1 elongation factor P [bacterium]HOH67360.1 elongation factor P [bacterium]
MISTLNDIKKGLNIIHEGEPYVVTEARFVRMQQRKPVMQTKLKNLLNGKVVEINYHPGDKVAEADLIRKSVDYLYTDGANYYFMTKDDFEQFDIPADTIGESALMLKEGNKVDALYFNGRPVSVSLPAKVELKVVAAPEGVKGNSAQGRVTKTAELETGLKIQVPLFIKEGDIIRINTDTGQYAERA